MGILGMERLLKEYILNQFLNIGLTSEEKDIADRAISKKYLPAMRKAFYLSILMIPSTIFLNTETIVSVLVPVTMVAGTAWFSVSLASMKKKFEKFGLELTLNLFTAFTLSLLLLFVITIASFTAFIWQPYVKSLENILIYRYISAILGSAVVFYLMW